MKPNRRSISGLVLVLLTSVIILLNTFIGAGGVNITSLRKIDDVANRSLAVEQKDAQEPKIPRQFIFVYLEDFVYANFLNTLSKYRILWSKYFGEDNSGVVFLNNYDEEESCTEVVTEVWPTLSKYYIQDPNIAHKSAICRIAALYKYGGYFFDNEIEVIKPLLLAPTTRFTAVASGHRFLNSFIASEPGHPVLRNTLTIMEKLYKGEIRLSADFMGPQALKLGYDATPLDEIGEHRLMAEVMMTLPYFKERYPSIPLQNGTGCCCNFAIHEEGLKDVFFYTRTVGASDKCM